MNNSTVHAEIELEKRMLAAFSNEGWECKSASERVEISENHCFSPDITLTKNGHVYGFVECYSLKDGTKISSRKQQQIVYILESYKPEVFILTNGTNYEVYFDGIFAGTMTVPISYHSYIQRERIDADAKAILEASNGKNTK